VLAAQPDADIWDTDELGKPDVLALAYRTYVEAGADAVGVQLSDAEEFHHIGARSRAPLVSLWPKARMTVLEFLQLGFRIALMPSSVSLAALSAVKEMLLELKDKGTERDYFNRQKDVQEVERWYRDLDMRRE
jgi:methylisocitrate lyase